MIGKKMVVRKDQGTMMSSLISVVVPIHKEQKELPMVRRQLHRATTPIEIIYVIHDELRKDLLIPASNEHIIRIRNRGRGYMLREGARHVKGDIIMFLHSDTLLPNNWDIIIRRVMQDKNVIGGGFSLQFDRDYLYFTLKLKMVTIIVRLTKVLTGDRAVFLRFQPFQNDLSILEMPIMEDIELSYWMKKHGKVILLRDAVVTSADAFVRHGLLRQTWRIILCLLWHIIGRNPQEIYTYYYS
jgi:glycosyltransferase involved in cell wall biosynthesis